MTFHIITLFPEMFRSYADDAMLGRAQKKGLIKVACYNPRDFTAGKRKAASSEWSYRRTDHKPYGGGPGMVMMAEPILRAAEKARGKKKNVKVILFSPSGKQFTNAYARTLSKKYDDIILIAGRYEGIDARVKKALRAEEVSIGPYVLTGGEVPAMAVVDAVARQIPGVLGSAQSLEEARVASPETYTRPEVIVHKGKKYKVPKVLLTGDHKKIEAWRSARRSTRPLQETTPGRLPKS